MNILHYLFGLGGRINRAKMWAFYLVSLGLQLVLALLQAVMPDLSSEDSDDPFADFLHNPRLWPVAALFIALCLAFLYSYFAVMVKRLHDRDRSAWWVAIFFVAPLLAVMAIVFAAQSLAPNGDINQSPALPALIVGFVIAAFLNMWGYVELYFLGGTIGDNRYGPDPLAARAP
jgi:uncharacterized membrane protein YhaH (DUF805 family)